MEQCGSMPVVLPVIERDRGATGIGLVERFDNPVHELYSLVNVVFEPRQVSEQVAHAVELWELGRRRCRGGV